ATPLFEVLRDGRGDELVEVPILLVEGGGVLLGELVCPVDGLTLTKEPHGRSLEPRVMQLRTASPHEIEVLLIGHAPELPSCAVLGVGPAGSRLTLKEVTERRIDLSQGLGKLKQLVPLLGSLGPRIGIDRASR